MCLMSSPSPAPDPYRPTGALPGTPEKLAVMAARAALRLPLFHRLDARRGEVGTRTATPDGPPRHQYRVYRMRRRTRPGRWVARVWRDGRWVRLWGDYATREEAEAEARRAA